MTSLAYRRSGSGEPLVLLHALGSSRQAWDPVTPALARHFDVIAVDLPGFGESAPLPGEPSPAALAAAVAGLLDELGVTNAARGRELTRRLGGDGAGPPPPGWRRSPCCPRPGCGGAARRTTAGSACAPRGGWPGTRPARSAGWSASAPGRVLVLGQTHGRPGRS